LSKPQPKEIPTSTIRGVTVVSPEGRLTTSGASTALGDRITQLHREGVDRFVIDLQRVRSFDSSMLGLMITFLTGHGLDGAVLVFARAPKALTDVWDIVRIGSVIAREEGALPDPFFNSVEEAVDAVLREGN
jgi:anti-anti-sigma regulatory factor